MNLQISHRLLPEGDTTGETILPIIGKMINAALSFVELSEESLETLAITDDTEFGPVIHKLQDEAGLAPAYTDHDMHKAVAKTIAKHRDDRITNSIVILDNIVAQVAMGAQAGDDLDKWDQDSQFCFYIFTHEVGHCKDNVLRPEPEEIPLLVNGEFRVQQIAKYYFSILMGEFAACVHSAGVMTEAVHQAEVKAWHDDVNEILSNIKKLVREYQSDRNKLYDLALFSAQGFWVIILQYTKIIGSKIGNPNLDQTPPAWIANNTRIEELLSKVTSTLREMWSKYPSWSITSVVEFLALWKLLALAHGYRFEETDGADALYLDHKSIFEK